jgi:hypothetical protein
MHLLCSPILTVASAVGRSGLTAMNRMLLILLISVQKQGTSGVQGEAVIESLRIVAVTGDKRHRKLRSWVYRLGVTCVIATRTSKIPAKTSTAPRKGGGDPNWPHGYGAGCGTIWKVTPREQLSRECLPTKEWNRLGSERADPHSRSKHSHHADLQELPLLEFRKRPGDRHESW